VSAAGVAAPASSDGAFVVTLDRYAGPLDLLLHLIRREEIDIWDIPVARIADHKGGQYAAD